MNGDRLYQILRGPPSASEFLTIINVTIWSISLVNALEKFFNVLTLRYNFLDVN